jgi:hypothetical protein
MQQTIYTLLTDEQARSAEVIEVLLDKGLVTGARWL